MHWQGLNARLVYSQSPRPRRSISLFSLFVWAEGPRHVLGSSAARGLLRGQHVPLTILGLAQDKGVLRPEVKLLGSWS